MKIKPLWLYVVLRVLWIVFLVLTCWIWIPGGFVLWFLAGVVVEIVGWYESVRRDWHRQREE